MKSEEARHRERFLAVITAVILTAVFIFTMVVDPQLKQRRMLSQNLHQLQIKLTKMKGDLLIKDRIEKIYSQIEPLIATCDTEQQQISAFTRQLSQIYSKFNVKIRSVKILPVSDENFYRRLTIKIEMTGHIKDFLKFAIAVEGLTDPIRIEQFDLVAQQSKDNVRVSMVITKVVSEPKYS